MHEHLNKKIKTVLNMSYSSSHVLTQFDTYRNLAKFVVNFIDLNGYQEFIQNMNKTLESNEHIWMAGYFSETSAQQSIIQKKGLGGKIRILSFASANASLEVPQSVGTVMW